MGLAGLSLPTAELAAGVEVVSAGGAAGDDSGVDAGGSGAERVGSSIGVTPTVVTGALDGESVLGGTRELGMEMVEEENVSKVGRGVEAGGVASLPDDSAAETDSERGSHVLNRPSGPATTGSIRPAR